jgi:hypothetical protein
MLGDAVRREMRLQPLVCNGIVAGGALSWAHDLHCIGAASMAKRFVQFFVSDRHDVLRELLPTRRTARAAPQRAPVRFVH